MGKAVYNNGHKDVLDSFLLKKQDVVSGKMFGYPAYYIRKKLFACIYKNDVSLKVPEQVANKLIGKLGIIHFQPLGRAKMKEWIQINRKRSKDYLKDKKIFIISMHYVSKLAKGK